MTYRCSLCGLCVLCALCGNNSAIAAENGNSKAIPVAKLERSTSVDFQTEVLPILRNSCLACHNRTKAKASLILETPADIKKGGDSGSAVIAGKPAESLLLKAASHDPSVDSPMPPPDNKVNAPDLKPDQLALIQLWIAQGASGEVHNSVAVKWRSIAPAVHPIYAIAISPDGDLAACGRGNEIFLYHLPDGRLEARLADPAIGTAHRDLVESLAFSHDGNLLASGSYREVKLWGWAGDWELERTVGGNVSSPFADRVTALDFNRRDTILAAGGGQPSRQGEIVLLDVPNLRVNRRLDSIHSDSVFALRFSPDGKHLASASADKFVRITDVHTGQVIHSLEGHSGQVLGVAWSRDGRTLASCGADGTIRTWDPITGERRSVITGFDKEVTSICFVGKTDQLVASSGDPKLRLLNAGGGDVRAFGGFSDFLDAAAVTPNGKLVLAGGRDGVLRIWNAATGRLVAEAGTQNRRAHRTVAASVPGR